MTIKIDLLPTEMNRRGREKYNGFFDWLWKNYIKPALFGLSGWPILWYKDTSARTDLAVICYLITWIYLFLFTTAWLGSSEVAWWFPLNFFTKAYALNTICAGVVFGVKCLHDEYKKDTKR